VVERTTAPHDGRAIHVRLTRAGRRLAAALTGEADEKLLALLDPLSPADRGRLSRLAAAVVQVSGSSSSAAP
jgi:DNA-binding MarR family transcriptional regulator